MTFVRGIGSEPGLITAAKAEVGRLISHILYFAGRGDPAVDRLYYSR